MLADMTKLFNQSQMIEVIKLERGKLPRTLYKGMVKGLFNPEILKLFVSGLCSYCESPYTCSGIAIYVKDEEPI